MTIHLPKVNGFGGGSGGGGSASFPTIVTDSGSSLPATTGFNDGDTFLNTSDKKIYKTEVNGYVANSNTTITSGIDVDYNTGIANFIGQQAVYCQRTINLSESWNNSGSATKTYYCKFKISSLNTNKPIFRLTSSNYGGPGSDSAEFAVETDNKIHHIRYESYYSTTVLSDVAILDTTLEVDTIYVLKIQKTGTDCVAQLTLEDNTVIEEKTFTTTNVSGSYPYNYIYYGNGYIDTGYPYTDNLSIYLLDSYGELLVPNTSTLSWDSGTDITDKTEYADKTNGILYLYENSELVKIGGALKKKVYTISADNTSTLDVSSDFTKVVDVLKNGVELALTDDYTISSGVITFVTALSTTDKITVKGE